MNGKCQQPSMNGIACGESFAILLGDFFDGTLSEEKSNEVREHMVSCENCKRMAQAIQVSRTLTQKAENGKTGYIHGISEIQSRLQIEKIKQAVRMEQKGKNQFGSDDQNTKKNKTFFAHFPKRMSFIYTAAGFVVMISVLALFIGGNNMLNNLTKSTDFLTDASGNYEAATQESSGCITNETAASSQYGDVTVDDSKDSQSDKGRYSDGSAAREVMAEAIDSIAITMDYSKELIDAMKGSVAYLAIVNSEDSYIAIAAYPDIMIQEKVDALFQIGNYLRLMNLTIEIEIISGENSQKLVEYTSRENVTFLQEIAEDNAAGFLVITINR